MDVGKETAEEKATPSYTKGVNQKEEVTENMNVRHNKVRKTV